MSDQPKTLEMRGWVTTWSASLLDSMLAPGISKFTAADIPDLRDAYPHFEQWLKAHFVNNVFHTQLPDEYKQLAINVIKRVQTAFRCYHIARDTTLSYLDGNNPLNPLPRVHIYFEALAMWESTFQNIAECVPLLKKFTGQKLFEKGEGTAVELAHGIAEDVRHTHGRIANAELSGDGTIPLWIENSGIRSVRHFIDFPQLAKLMSDAAEVAAELQDIEKLLAKVRAAKAASEPAVK